MGKITVSAIEKDILKASKDFAASQGYVYSKEHEYMILNAMRERVKDIQEENNALEDVLVKIGKEITDHQFEVYNPLRKIVVELPEIVAVFDRNGIDIVDNPKF